MSIQFKRVLKTVLAVVYMLVFYIISGAIVVTNNLGDLESMLVQGAFIWSSVIILLASGLFWRRSGIKLGFKKIASRPLKPLLFFIPMLLIIASNMWGGIDFGKGWKFILACLFITTGVGFSEEIICRGIVFNIWKEKSLVKGGVISSIIFGMCHIFNILGGASVAVTLLQICFAFFYGVVMALIYYKAESILPCIILHFLHDFSSFISVELPLKTDIIIAAVQTVILVGYGVHCLMEKKTKRVFDGKL